MVAAGETLKKMSLVPRLLNRYCARKGLRLVLDPDLGNAGFIETPAGGRSFFKGTHFDLNPLGAAEIAADKDYSLTFWKADGFRVPDSLLIGAPSLIESLEAGNAAHKNTLRSSDDARMFANDVGFPVFLKPNDGQEGRDVIKIHDSAGLEPALTDLFLRHDKVLLQEAVQGADVRVLVLDGSVLCAIERKPPSVVGDGKTAISDLIAETHRGLCEDPRMAVELAAQDCMPNGVPEAGETICLLPNANLSAGGKGRLITKTIASHLKQTAISAVEALGLRYAGLDMVVSDPVGTDSNYVILEANAAPGLNRFAAQGTDETKAVKAVYERVFDAMTDGL